MQRELVLPRPAAWTGLAKLVLLLAAALAITNMGWPQPVTGTLVNALLFLAVEWAGLGSAMMVGMVTPVGAAARGVLPLPLLVMVPFIALGNATLVAVYNTFRERNRVVAIAVAAVAKFALLYGMVTLLVVLPMTLAMAGGAQTVKMPVTIVGMMQWPQLATALAGGVLALGIRWGVQRLDPR